MNLNKIIFLGLLLVISLLYGCGGKQLTEEKTAPYKTAVTSFLAKKSLGMKVVEFKSLNISGDKATGVIKLQDAEGLYAIKTKWQFTFKKTDGEWMVLGYKVL
jgi:hypothetical protein